MMDSGQAVSGFVAWAVWFLVRAVGHTGWCHTPCPCCGTGPYTDLPTLKMLGLCACFVSESIFV